MSGNEADDEDEIDVSNDKVVNSIPNTDLDLLGPFPRNDQNMELEDDGLTTTQCTMTIFTNGTILICMTAPNEWQRSW